MNFGMRALARFSCFIISAFCLHCGDSIADEFRFFGGISGEFPQPKNVDCIADISRQSLTSANTISLSITRKVDAPQLLRAIEALGTEVLSLYAPVGKSESMSVDEIIRDLAQNQSPLRYLSLNYLSGKHGWNAAVVAKLPKLEYLEIHGGELDVESARWLAKLPKLRTLLIRHRTAITDAVLSELSTSRIQAIGIGGKDVTGVGFASWAESETLTSVDVSGVSLSLDGLKAISKLSHLRHLDMSATGISIGLPNVLSELQSLESLVIGGTRGSGVDDTLMETVARLPELKHLDVMASDISGRGLQILSQSARLESLMLAEVRLDPDAVTAIGRMTTLKSLNLVATQVNDEALLQFLGLTSLQCLNLQSTDVSAKGLDVLKRFKLLCWLNIRYTKIRPDSISELGKITTLEELIVSGPGWDMAAMEHLRAALPGCLVE